MDNTRTRLDKLENNIGNVQTTVNGMEFTSSIKNAWTVHTSATGLILATYELDIDNSTSWSWVTSSSPYGSYRLSYDIQENLPVGIFTLPPAINLMCYVNNENYSFLNICSAPPSNTYIGKWQTIMLDKDGKGENKPTSFHLVIQATGF